MKQRFTQVSKDITMTQTLFVITLIFQIVLHSITVTTVLVSNVIQSEKHAILDVFYATNGWEWYISWNITLLEECVNNTQCSICDLHLYNITCHNHDNTNNSRITFIDLQYNNLRGTIPDSIGIMNELTVLALGGNQLTGTIPDSIWNLTKLSILFLQENELQGILPDSIGNLNQLVYLSLSQNKLNGTIPDSIGKLTKLSLLYLWGNELTGTIPDTMGNLVQLTNLQLASNQLNGTIPASIGNLIGLYNLQLANNRLNGIIPDSFKKLTRLYILYLWGNELNGTIPDWIGNLTDLQYLSLQQNQLTGTIPFSIGNLKKLSNLQIYDNELTGPIPDSMNNLKQLTVLDGSRNKLNGTIPNGIGNLTQLYILYFWDNELTGTIPQLISNLNNLKYFALSNNKLNGTIPDSLGALTELTILAVGSNQLTGTIPNSIGNLTKLSMLHIWQNGVSGMLPDRICNLIDLTDIELSRNKLSGTIPNCIGNLRKASILYLYDNELSGTIPDSISNLNRSLTGLDISGNKLDGTIPNWIGEMSELTILALAPNQLIGTIPESIGNLTKLSMLHIWGCEISGTIPDSMRNLVKLTNLEFAESNLNGTIPNWIGDLSKLSRLRLWGNELTGTIPYSIGNLNELELLELGENKLNGVIPNSIGNLTKLSTWYLWNNELSGTIPKSIGNLNNLSALYLWGNKLTGGIPDSIGNLTNLENIQLSDNKLDGTIPNSIGQLTKLQVLNIENNNLYSNDIVPLLANLFDDKHNLSLISIANNPHIKGDLSKLTIHYTEHNGSISNSYNYSYNSKLEYFIGYNCDLYGSLPNNIQFINLKYFIIHKNRLGCELPNHLLSNTNNSSVVVLLSNLFQVKSSNQFVSWMDSSFFKTVNSMYITNADLSDSTMIVSLAAIITGVCVFTQLFTLARHVLRNHNCNFDNIQSETIYTPTKKNSSAKTIAIELFLGHVLSLGKSLSQLKCLLCISLLAFLYSIHSTYFQCLPILDKLSLSYYETTNDALDWMLIFLLATSYAILCRNLFGLRNDQTTNAPDDAGNAAWIDDYQPMILQSQSESISIDNETSTVVFKMEKIFAVIVFIVYFALLILATVFVILSIIVDNLPNDNIFNLDELETKAIQSLLPLILTLNTAIIIPKFVDSCYQCYTINNINNNNNNNNNSFSIFYVSKYRSRIILLLRTFSIIIVPFISSLIILPNCGNNWFYFWNQCTQTKKNQLNVKYTNHDIVLDYTNDTYTDIFQESILFSSSDICQSGGFDNIEWNKCLRTFSSQWSLVINKKLCIMIVSPIVVVSFNYIKHKIISMVRKCISKTSIDNTMVLNVDVEYAMFLTKCESMIIWFPISPFVFPLTIASIYTNYYIYYLMIDKYQWQLKPFNIYVGLPIDFMWIAIVLSQIYLCVFIIICIGNKTGGYILVAILILLDIGYFVKLKYFISFDHNYTCMNYKCQFTNCNCCVKNNNIQDRMINDRFQKL